MTITLEIIVCSIGRKNGMVVVAEHNESTGSDTGDLLVVAILTLEFLFRSLAKEIVVGAHVRETRIHGNDRIEENLEVGGSVATGVSGKGGGKMSTCRRTHDAHLVGVDVPRLGIAAHKTHSLLGVLKGHLVYAVGHTIFQHHGGNTHVVEKRSPVAPLMIHCEMGIATTWTNHDAAPSGTLRVGKAHINLGSVGGNTIACGCAIWP